MERAFITIVFLTLSMWVVGQHLPIQKLTPQQGLKGMQVLAVLQDSRGMVWTGGYLGLNRYNGEQFTHHSFQDSVFSNTVNNLMEDRHGNIWFEVPKRGVIKYDGHKFTKIPTEFTRLVLGKDKEIYLWRKQDLYKVVGDRISEQSSLHLPDNVTSEYLNYIPGWEGFLTYTGEYDKSPQYILVTSQKVARLSHIPAAHTTLQAIWDNALLVSQTLPGSNREEFFYATRTTCQLVATRRGRQLTVHTPLPHDIIIGSPELFAYLPAGSQQAIDLGEYPTIVDKASMSNRINTGPILWLGTEKGLWGITRKGFTYFTEKEVPYCWGVTEDNAGNFYFANYSYPINYYNSKTNKITVWTKSLERAAGELTKNRSNGWYFKPFKDIYGNLWFGEADGFYQYIPISNKWINHRVQQPGFDNIVFSMANDPFRRKTVGASTRAIFTIEQQPPYRKEIIQDTTSFFKALTMDVTVDARGTYWACNRNGVVNYDPDTRRFTYYTSQTKAFESGYLGGTQVYFDRQGQLWVAARTGLFLFDARNRKFNRLFAEVLSGHLNFIQQISATHYIIGTDSGIYAFNYQEYLRTKRPRFVIYNQHTGYPGIEPGQLGAFQDSKGMVWVTSGTVLTRMNPAELDFKPSEPRIFLTHVGQEGVSFVSPPAVLELPKGENAASFTFETFGENKPYRSEYSFRIPGYLDEWSDWRVQNVVMVNNLPNGEHLLEVRTRTGLSSHMGDAILRQRFLVDAPVYKSPNFYKYAGIFGALGGLLMLLMASRLRRDTIEMAEQDRKLSKQETNVKMLKIRTIQSQMNPHFTFNVLNTLQHYIESNEKEKAIEGLQKLSALTRNFLESSIISNTDSASKYDTEVKLERELSFLEMYMDFEKMQYANRFEYQIMVDPALDVTNYRIPPLLIQPFVENAIKHGLLYKTDGEMGKLHIRIYGVDEDTILCEIEDNGVGREAARKIQQNSTRKYKSRGVALVKERIALLNETGYDITLTISDRHPSGTLVHLQIGYKDT